MFEGRAAALHANKRFLSYNFTSKFQHASPARLLCFISCVCAGCKILFSNVVPWVIMKNSSRSWRYFANVTITVPSIIDLHYSAIHYRLPLLTSITNFHYRLSLLTSITMTFITNFHYSNFHYQLPLQRLSLPTSITVTSITDFNYSDFHHQLQLQRNPSPTSIRGTSITNFNYSHFHHWLQLQQLQSPTSITVTSITNFNYRDSIIDLHYSNYHSSPFSVLVNYCAYPHPHIEQYPRSEQNLGAQPAHTHNMKQRNVHVETYTTINSWQ